jgi:C4-dicarboxylate-specific signal transduction histidine kinase
VARDISSQKQAEEANRKLAHVSRLATIGELTAIIAHEVSQPLNAILTNVEAGELVARQDPPPITELLTILGDIRRDNLRAVEAIRCVRAFSKKNDTQKSVVHLHALIEDVLQLVGGEISRRRIQVHTHMGGDLPTVLGDRLGLQQVVLNLIVNAMDALDELPESERLLWIGAENTGKEVLVSIKDNGKGLPAGIVGQSFESFFTTKREGLGLGPSVSRSIVQAHGGSLRAENNKTRGATFSFTLPLNPPGEP